MAVKNPALNIGGAEVLTARGITVPKCSTNFAPSEREKTRLGEDPATTGDGEVS
jgi:hypothetical protein